MKDNNKTDDPYCEKCGEKVQLRCLRYAFEKTYCENCVDIVRREIRQPNEKDKEYRDQLRKHYGLS